MNESNQNELSILKESLRDITAVCQTLANEINRLDDEIMYLRAYRENCPYELHDSHDKREHTLPKVMSVSDTIQKVIQDRLSVARFGDGEFAIMSGVQRYVFQNTNQVLAERLLGVLHSNHPRLMIAIADNYGSLEKYNTPAADAIRLYLTHQENRRKQTALLDLERKYGNAYMSRPYVLYKDNMTNAPQKRFEYLKQIWENRHVLIIEGTQTRMGVGNNLLNNAKTIRRILAPSVNAFDNYDVILSTALKYAEKDILFLIALGPTAGILAYDLTLAGYQAIDIGHADLEYEWFLAGKGERTPVPYKYNNELKGDQDTLPVDDPIYFSQILCSTESV